MAISNMFIEIHNNYIHNIWLKRGYLDPNPHPCISRRDVAYPGARQSGHNNHIPT